MRAGTEACPNCGGKPHHGLAGKRVCGTCHFHYFVRRPKATLQRARLASIGPKGRAFGRSWRSLKPEILKRDHQRCRYCGEWAAEVHHVVKRSQSTGLRLERDNLVSLCRNCHNWTDAAGLAARGRLVITALGGERFSFHVRMTDKFTARDTFKPRDKAHEEGELKDLRESGRRVGA